MARLSRMQRYCTVVITHYIYQGSFHCLSQRIGKIRFDSIEQLEAQQGLPQLQHLSLNVNHITCLLSLSYNIYPAYHFARKDNAGSILIVITHTYSIICMFALLIRDIDTSHQQLHRRRQCLLGSIIDVEVILIPANIWARFENIVFYMPRESSTVRLRVALIHLPLCYYVFCFLLAVFSDFHELLPIKSFL